MSYEAAEKRIAEAERTGATVLSLSTLRVTRLPEWLGNLTNLTTLYVGDNNLTSLPESLGNLTNLTALGVSSNQLTSLPEWLGNLTNLTRLDVYDNPLSEMPPEVVRQGNDAILNYLRELARDAQRHWVSKMLLVGQGGVGKTNLLRRLKGEEFEPSQDTTHGIAIRDLCLAHPTESDTTMTLNVWDFAGQQINHATHQFFLANRSLYLLVWNARHDWEQGKINYWLETIRARAGDEVPILIVATHTDQRLAQIPQEQIQREYPQVIDCLAVSNQSAEGIDALRDKIAELSANLPLMGQKISKRWADAIRGVRNLPESEKHRSLTQFQALLQTHYIERDAMGVLTQWMHDLGEILHFQDKPELNDLVILKPQWVTEHIAKVLNDADVQKRAGVFTRAEMKEVWSDLDSSLHDHFLMLLEQFDLSYRIPDDPENKSLVVECVPWEEPSYTERWEEMKGQREVSMHFQLSSIPAGIPTWTIARQHRFTLGLHWRLGALFGDKRNDPKHLALLQASPSSREVRLTVRGSAPHDFFALVRDGLQLTLDRFLGLGITCLIPCCCEEGCTHRFDLETLKRYYEHKKSLIDCGKTLNEVPVAELLYGFTPGALYEKIDAMEAKILQHSDENTALIMAGIAEMIPILQREFVKAFHEQQRLVESHCPNVFLLKEKGQRGIGSLFSRPLELHLCCQYPGKWHIVGEPYNIPQAQEWLQNLKPLMEKSLKILKYVSLVKPSLKVWHKEWSDALESHLDLVDAWQKELKDHPIPETFDGDIIGSNQEYWKERTSSEMPAPIEGYELRQLRALLKKSDPNELFRGLEKILTPEGHYLWLCQEHAEEFRR